MKDLTRKNPEVLNYLYAENNYTAASTRRLLGLMEDLYSNMLSRHQQDDSSWPEQYKNYLYYSKTNASSLYPTFYRKPLVGSADEQLILDVNQLAAVTGGLSVRPAGVSPNERIFSYTVDYDGSEIFTIFFKDMETGQLLSQDQIQGVSRDLEWVADSSAVYYIRMDDTNRAYQTWKHIMGTESTTDTMVYEEKDASFSVHLSKSNDENYIYIVVYGATSSEVWFAPSDASSQNPFRRFLARRQDVLYAIEHQNGICWIVTNKNFPQGKLMRVSVADWNPNTDTNWVHVLRRPSVNLEGISIHETFLTLIERESGYTQLSILNTKTNELHRIELPEAAHGVDKRSTSVFNSTKIQFWYQSLKTPEQLWEYDVSTRQRVLLKTLDAVGYNPDSYESAVEWADSADGTKIPVSMVWKKTTVRSASTPFLLEAYGSYGVSMEPYFSSSRLALLDRGFVYGIAHIRGGSEFGQRWWDQGRLLNKTNTFADFAAAAKHVIDHGYTSSSRLAIAGGSAGGTLMGVMMNQYSSLFGAIVAEVPFVDVINTLLDESLPLTISDWDEWGNPANKTFYDYMITYSPYDNVQPRDNWPAMLITGGLNDRRVPFWEPAKLVAKLRCVKKDDSPLLLVTKMDEGHMGSSALKSQLRDLSLQYAFLIDVVGRNDIISSTPQLNTTVSAATRLNFCVFAFAGLAVLLLF